MLFFNREFLFQSAASSPEKATHLPPSLPTPRQRTNSLQEDSSGDELMGPTPTEMMDTTGNKTRTRRPSSRATKHATTREDRSLGGGRDEAKEGLDRTVVQIPETEEVEKQSQHSVSFHGDMSQV